MIRVAVLGATGSIGRSTLEVAARHPGRFEIVALTANGRVDELERLVEEHRPGLAILVDEEALLATGGGGVRDGVEWRGGRAALLDVTRDGGVDVVVNAVVGSAGLEPTLAGLGAGKRVALANKESLVAGGDLVMKAAEEGGGDLIPVDSEHSAILQCLEGAGVEALARVVLTASGGPFRGHDRGRLAEVGRGDALRHPTWEMGAKITIDSATLANKALEVIEAHFLYGLDYGRIDVVVHPQSIVHSFVEFVDGSVLAQVGEPTMELPILYALCYPERVADPTLRTFDPVAMSPLTFEEVDHDAFRLFGLGLSAGREGGVAPAVFNAGNEVAVEAFLQGGIGFLDMPTVVSAALEGVPPAVVRNVEDVLQADRRARVLARAAADECEQRKAKK